jgi:hypothetical protein
MSGMLADGISEYMQVPRKAFELADEMLVEAKKKKE